MRKPRPQTQETPWVRNADGTTEHVVTEKLQKALADAGWGSRREMERLIESGVVTVNGQPAKLGDRVKADDVIRVEGRTVRRQTGDEAEAPRVLLYHKPAGEIVTRDDPEGRPSVFAHLPRVPGGRWIAVGRLDFNTEGLLIFTTSGSLANRLMHPRFELEREYAVRTVGELSEEDAQKLLAGVDLEDGPAKFETLTDEGGKGLNHWYAVTIREGRNREVRRLFESVNLTVSRLIRVRYGDVELPSGLLRGKMKELEPADVKRWIAALERAEKAVSPEAAREKAEEVKAEKAAARIRWRERMEREEAERTEKVERSERRPRREGASDRTGVPFKGARDLSERPTQRAYRKDRGFDETEEAGKARPARGPRGSSRASGAAGSKGSNGSKGGRGYGPRGGRL
ncbi:23S rRNA pseudouridine(2605) synthase RluB [Sutterella sp.]|uniref:23S rRNA pseudouridine(2605) synthase RluB n=1 Tax=Sutterella sp. TaxID=1981025 RepID=UPI0026E10EAC|nr:pseudouridine synthase [Sutterella sp.]MDO5531077.1 pseudouridine synthase [Sutterella sp.]